MPISKANAESALKALQGLATGQLVGQFVDYAYRKHVDKARAAAAAVADGETKGYVKKVASAEVANLRDYKALSERQQRHVTGIPSRPKGPSAKDFGKNKDVSYTLTLPLSEADFSTLLALVVRTAGGALYRANAEVESRFLYVVDMPSGYVGRSIDPQGAKAKDLEKLVLIVIGGANPKLLNMFPADDVYVGQQTPLV